MTGDVPHLDTVPRNWPWRTMESAPKDGRRFLAVVDGAVRLVSYGKTSHVPLYGFCLADQGPEDYEICEPTLWHPLPAPPVLEERIPEGLGRK